MKTKNACKFTRRLSNSAALCLVSSLLLARTAALGASDPPEGLSQSARNEIAALLQEKASRTPAQQKMDSQLVHAVKHSRGEPFAPGAPNLQMDVKFEKDGRVLVDIDASVTPALLALIPQGGGQVISSFAQFRAIRALVTVGQLETLASSQDVTYIGRARESHTNKMDSEGDTTHQAILARSTFGVSGSGIPVGVLSDSVDYLTNLQASNDVGAVTILPGQSGIPATGEGTAMLEIVHDLAPGSPLYFATADGGEAGFAYNILNLWTNGCKVIVDDVGYFDESPFQDGIIAQAVNTVTANGALYFSAAGNSGNKDDGTSGTWEGDFVDGGAAGSPITEAGRLHSFGANTYDTLTANGFGAFLFWSDPLGGSCNDYDLFVLNSTGTTVLHSSTAVQSCTQNPYESCATEVNDRIVVLLYNGVARYLQLATQRGTLSVSTSGATVGHSAAVNAFSVAAIDVHTTAPFPSPFTGGAANPFEFFSSDGLRHVFFNADGTAITPGNFSSTGGAIRQKPDIAAANGVSTDVPGFQPFYGTSAAAPHAAAIAALLWSLAPGLNTAQIRAILTGTALDVNPPGVDRDTGWGIVMANLALAAGQTAPTNDQCASAIVASGFYYTNRQSTVYATSTGPPSPSCIYNFGNGVWYQYTAPATGDLDIDTIGSSFDTALGLYIGACGSLTQVACDDDSGGNLTSKITYPVTAGTTYYMLAGGYNHISGNLVFHLALSPAGQSVSIGASDTGWYDSTGYHNPANANYFVGQVSGTAYHDFFVFPLPQLSGFTITSAQLLINSYTDNGGGGSATYQLNDVTTPIPTLEAGGTGLTGIYDDLANGTVYGSQVIPNSASGTIVTIPLNTAFVNAAMAAGGQIALGGNITSLVGTNDDYLFGASAGFPGDVRLELTFAPSVTVDATDTGWYDSTGHHLSGNANYVVGQISSTAFNNFFVFPVPLFDGVITGAKLLINSYTDISGSGANTYQLNDVTTDIGTLETGGTGLTYIFNDLGSGTVYGNQVIPNSASGTTVTIPLNSAFLTAAMAASGGQIAVGGNITSPLGTNDDYLFGFGPGTGSPGDVRLELTFAPTATVNAADTGWYDNTGFHTNANHNYAVGESGVTYHDFFVFPVPNYSGSIVKAELLVNTYSVASPAGVPTCLLHQVSTPIATLEAGGSGLTSIYNDLGGGAIYAVRDFSPSESSMTAIVPLNGDFINAASAARGSQIALGGSVFAPANGEYAFGFSTGNPTDARLRLTFGTSVLLTTTSRGWYDSTGAHTQANHNYFAGDAGSNSYRNFFAFNVPALSDQIVNAQLLLNSFIDISPLGVQSYVLHDVTTPIATLLAGGSGLTGIYADLGNGVNYGGRNIYDSETSTISAIPLNTLFQNAAVAASGGQIALGGTITTLDPPPSASTEELFAFSDGTNAADTELFLGFMTGNPPSPVLVPPFTHFANGDFEFGVSGSASSYEIDVSTDLQNWDVLGTLTMTNPVSYFLDPSPNQAYRFYQARFIQ